MVERASTPPVDGEGDGEGDGDGERDGDGDGEGEGDGDGDGEDDVPALVVVDRAGTVSVLPSENVTTLADEPKLCATYVRAEPFTNTAAVGLSAVTPGSTTPILARL
ncbi:hypothetical protein [Microbispora sp. NBC_01389]|uniref:hypothetical protein n=1 Tax=Microbispora sp. NBC_01389 TaxID=2903584 RepID=UPI003864143C